MTSIEVPYSIAAALPSLSVMDITNDVSRRGRRVRTSAAASPTSTPRRTLSLVRVQERETGFFEDLESLLERVVPGEPRSRERLLAFLLGPRSEQVPFATARSASASGSGSSSSRSTRSTARTGRSHSSGSEYRQDRDARPDPQRRGGAARPRRAPRCARGRARGALRRDGVARAARRRVRRRGGILGAMAGYAPSAGLGCKLVTLFPENRDRPTHQAAIALFDPRDRHAGRRSWTGRTSPRCAPLRRPRSRRACSRGRTPRVLAILGTGVQSRSAQEMFPRARDFAEVRVAGRGEFEDAVRGADVVHATTGRARSRSSAATG